MTFRWMQLVVLILALAIPFTSQGRPKDQRPATNAQSNSAQPSTDNGNANATVVPNEQDADHQSNAVNASETLEKSQSEMQKSAFAPQKARLEAQRELALQTSSDSLSWSSTASLIWSWVLVAVLVVLAVVAWRSGRRHSAITERPAREIRRAA